jgi:hypothetical protein
MYLYSHITLLTCHMIVHIYVRDSCFTSNLWCPVVALDDGLLKVTLFLVDYSSYEKESIQNFVGWQAVCFNHQDPVLHNHGSQHTVNVLPHLACLLRQTRGCSRPIRGTPGPTRGLIQVHVFNFYQTIIHIGTQQSSVCFPSHMRSNPRGTMWHFINRHQVSRLDITDFPCRRRQAKWGNTFTVCCDPWLWRTGSWWLKHTACHRHFRCRS